jgi:hypothetical protein
LAAEQETDALGELDPIQAELIRVMLANPLELSAIELEQGWVDDDLADLMVAIDKARQVSPPGTPLDLEGLPFGEVVQKLAFDQRPLPTNPMEVVRRAEDKAIERQIKGIEVELADLDPSGQEYSDLFRRLLGLQERRRTPNDRRQRTTD